MFFLCNCPKVVQEFENSNSIKKVAITTTIEANILFFLGCRLLFLAIVNIKIQWNKLLLSMLSALFQPKDNDFLYQQVKNVWYYIKGIQIGNGTVKDIRVHLQNHQVHLIDKALHYIRYVLFVHKYYSVNIHYYSMTLVFCEFKILWQMIYFCKHPHFDV